MKVQKYSATEHYRVLDDEDRVIIGVTYRCRDSEVASDFTRYGFFESVRLRLDDDQEINIDLLDGEARTRQGKDAAKNIIDLDSRSLSALRELPEHVRRTIGI